jgi:hypothetical protein
MVEKLNTVEHVIDYVLAHSQESLFEYAMQFGRAANLDKPAMDLLVETMDREVFASFRENCSRSSHCDNMKQKIE